MTPKEGKKKMEANFDVTPGDVLKLIEEGRAGIKVFSLTIDGKKFLCLIIYDQNVVFLITFDLNINNKFLTCLFDHRK